MKSLGIPVLSGCAALILSIGPAVGGGALDEALGGRLAGLALDCVHREYPNKIAHVLQSDEDALPPRKMTPSFYGCYDWHSAVHGHWLLVRLARTYPEAAWAATARAALATSLTPEKIAGEVAYIRGEGRTSFERPYGLAWLLQLSAELRAWEDPEAQRWSTALLPLEQAVVERLATWLPKLTYPIREGEHGQTAFAFGLILDWAHSAGNQEIAGLLEERTRTLYGADRDCPLGYEPSGHDFLSPCIAEADLMRRVLSSGEFAGWLNSFLPGIPRTAGTNWLKPAVVSDPTDGKLVHLDGLNLSRAWMLEGIASGLPADDPRRASLLAAAATHAESGLQAVSGENYEGGHWLGSFATYLVTGRGLARKPKRSAARAAR